MKRLFIAQMLLNAVATEAAANAQTGGEIAKPEKVYSSPKTDELNVALKAAWEKMVKLPFGSKEALDANMEVFNLRKQIDAEIAGLKKAEQDAIVTEKRNARIKMVDDLIEAVREEAKLPKSASEADKTAASEKVTKLREPIATELSARYATSAPAKTDGKPAGEKGATAKAIMEKYHAYVAAGQTSTEAKKSVIADGFSRGTVGAVVLAWEQEAGIK